MDISKINSQMMFRKNRTEGTQMVSFLFWKSIAFKENCEILQMVLKIKENWKVKKWGHFSFHNWTPTHNMWPVAITASLYSVILSGFTKEAE